MKFVCKWNERYRLLHVSLLILLKRVIYLSLDVILKRSYASNPRSRAVASNTALQSCLRIVSGNIVLLIYSMLLSMELVTIDDQ